MTNEKFSPIIQESIKEYIRKNGFRCFYTGMLLELDDDKSPWYCSFDHVIPGDPRKVVLTSGLFNAMKTDLSLKELWYYVLQLDDHRRKHLKMRKRHLIYWNRLSIVPYKRVTQCPICGRRRLKHHEYCARCAKFGHRMKAKFPKATSKAIWAYLRKFGFICYYTGMPLDTDNPKSAWYCVFDHCYPANPKKVVLTSFLINDMKSDLTEKEFFWMIHQLAEYKRHGTKIRKRKFRFWRRPYRGDSLRAKGSL